MRPCPCTQSASAIRGLADSTSYLERSTVVMSNSEELYAGKCCTCVLSAWHVHVHVHVVEQQVFCRSYAFLFSQCPNSAIILEGRPEPGLLAMLPVS